MSKARVHLLKFSEPNLYVVTKDGVVSYINLQHLGDDDTKKLKEGGARILRRRERRAALRALRVKWPLGGSAPARHLYA